MAKEYDPKEIESKWQREWEEEGIYHASNESEKLKYYSLVEFPYPSGDGLHVGHPRPYIGMDVVSRKRRMQGFNVLYPIGWDAFGLPTENYAIKTGRPPAEITKENSDTFRRQIQSLGISFDWSREINTTDPKYYKWTQWLFLRFLEKGLAYKARIPINWCPKDKIGLANEEVVDGKCERCGTPVEQREKEQWMLKITAYAERLLSDLDTVDYPERVKTQQINWIGKSEGMNFKCKVKGKEIYFDVFDSVPQTFMAQTFSVIAADHPKLFELVKGAENETEILNKAREINKAKSAANYDIEKQMDGIFTGEYLENPYGTGDLPIWVASFAIADYGSGVVNCSAHDERDFAFAKKFNLPLRPVMFPRDPKEAKKVRKLEYCFHHDPEGVLEAPTEFAGRKWGEVREDIIKHIENKGMGERTVQFKLRDWVFSRQRYWGEPIPVIHCEKCGVVPVPEKDLPVLLPDVKNYQPTDTGESPLANISEWVNTSCPKCGGEAKRETDTMPNWAGSSWYFLRYCDHENDRGFASQEALKYWMPVDWYNGGMEHTVLHLLYSRFWNKFLFDLGLVPSSEPYKKRTSHGLIMAEDGRKMSKSLGNVINPDEIVDRFGADTLRVYEMFMGPFEQAIAWSESSLVGPRRFLEKVWKFKEQTSGMGNEILLNQTVKKVSEDIETLGFNTAVSSLMILANDIEKKGGTSLEEFEILLKLLAPFAPHMTEELWQSLGHASSIHAEPWPQYDKTKLEASEITIAVQVNGKVRGSFSADVNIEEAEAIEKAKSLPEVQKWIGEGGVKKAIYVPKKVVSLVV